MKDSYRFVRNTILFYFIAILIGVNLTLPTSFAEKLLVGMLFGVATTLIPHILKFFKLPVNEGSTFLMGMILAFIYFFGASYIFELVRFTSQSPDILSFLGIKATVDNLTSIVYITLISAIVLVAFDSLEKNS